MNPRVRLATPTDAPAALALAHRLEIGVAPWRAKPEVGRIVRGWIETSMAAIDDDAKACFVADDSGETVGFCSVEESKHWTGTIEAYIGELIVAEAAEGKGVGRALVEAAADWGRARGCARIALDTGARNTAAIAFYHSLDFDDEEVRLSRSLG